MYHKIIILILILIIILILLSNNKLQIIKCMRIVKHNFVRILYIKF